MGALYHCGHHAIEGVHLGQVEEFERGGVAIGACTVGACSTYAEADEVLGIGTEVACLVDHADGNEGEVFAIGCEAGAVGYQLDVVGLTGGVDFAGGYGFAFIVVGYDLDGAGFVAGVHPHEAVAGLTLELGGREGVGTVFGGDGEVFGATALTLAIDEEFGTGVVGVDKDGGYLAFASGPGPMWQEVKGFGGLVPVTAIEVVAVFGKAGKVDDAEE